MIIHNHICCLKKYISFFVLFWFLRAKSKCTHNCRWLKPFLSLCRRIRDFKVNPTLLTWGVSWMITSQWQPPKTWWSRYDDSTTFKWNYYFKKFHGNPWPKLGLEYCRNIDFGFEGESFFSMSDGKEMSLWQTFFITLTLTLNTLDARENFFLSKRPPSICNLRLVSKSHLLPNTFWTFWKKNNQNSLHLNLQK